MRIAAKKRTGTAESYVERVNRAIDRVLSGLDEPLRLRDLGEAAGLSPFHFHRVFQALVGETPADFVKRRRLEKALGMMAQARRPSLTQIALACGFNSSSDFTRSFRQRFGAAPSAFDIAGWRKTRAGELEAGMNASPYVSRLPRRSNPEGFQVRIREIAARSVAYIRVSRPYEGDRVLRATKRLIAWAERQGVADGQWLGYQWENPEITALRDCGYYIAVEAGRFEARGEIGRHRFPAMVVAEVEIRGGVELELAALQWLYGSWLPRSVYEPDDQPGFEAFIGRPFGHGTEYFALRAQVPVRRKQGALHVE